MSKLERLVVELEGVTGRRLKSSELYAQAYQPSFRAMTKRIGEMIIYYREGEDGYYDFECVIREKELPDFDRGNAA